MGFFYAIKLIMELVVIGRTHKPTGLKGEIQLIIQDEYLEELEHLEVLFIRTYSKPAPYFIEYLLLEKMPTIKIEEVDNKEAAKKFSSKEVSIRKSDLLIPEEERIIGSQLEYHFLLGL